jgi:hypothetical protein
VAGYGTMYLVTSPNGPIAIAVKDADTAKVIAANNRGAWVESTFASYWSTEDWKTYYSICRSK